MNERRIPAEDTVKTLMGEIEDVFGRLDAWCLRPLKILDLTPPDVGWSVRLILEHIGIVNRYLLLTLGKGVKLAVRRAVIKPIPEKESNLAMFTEIADPDAFDWRPPEHMIPQGSVSIDEIRSTLAFQHRECCRLLEKMPKGEGFLHTVRMSVRNLGRLDMYQWLWFILMHARRHLMQMERVETRAE